MNTDPLDPDISDVDETIDERPRIDPDSSSTVDRVVEQFAEDCRRGEGGSIADYEARYPEHAERLRKLLPTVALMEQLKRGTAAARDKDGEPAMPVRLGEFRVLRELGRGGMGVVYEAVQETLGRHVALKVVHHVHLDLRRLERFRRETQAIAQLHHTNIVPIYGVGEHEGLPYFAMQYIDGSGLDVLLNRWRSVKSSRRDDLPRFVANLGRQAAEALQYAHEQGILHRDIKPANLLLDDQEGLWVTDFGLAKLAGQEDLTASGDVIGTLRYLAPEALRGETDPRSDVYSLGLTLYELLTLRAPYGDITPSAMLHQISAGQLVRPRKLESGIPRDLETIILKAVAREPDHRYPTAGALASDLRRFLEDRPITARPTTSFERAWRWSRRNKLTAILMATAAASLLLAAVVGWIGYVSTTKAFKGESDRRHEAEAATERANENVKLSLRVFGELFAKLSPAGDPFPPPVGRSQPSSRIKPNPPRDDGTGRRPPPPSGLGGNPFEPRTPRPPDDPQGPPRRADSRADTALLQSILTFYEQFATRNETDPVLQYEAASAYFKVGALYQRLGRDADALAAETRAGDMVEDLVRRFPNETKYQTRLVEIAMMAAPWSADPGALDKLRIRFVRTREIIDRLATEAPDNLTYLQDQVFVHAKLGVVLQRLGKLDDAEASYRNAVRLVDRMCKLREDNDRPKVDRSDIVEELAMLRFERGHPEEARTLLDSAIETLRGLKSEIARHAIVADRYTSLAEDYRRIGEPTRADELEKIVAQIKALPRPSPPSRPGPSPRPLENPQ